MKHICLFIILVCYFANSQAVSFSSTQNWDYELENYSENSGVNFLPENWRDLLGMLPPPSNESKVTSNELSLLVKLKEQRDIQTIQRIKDERTRELWQFGPSKLHDLLIWGEPNPLSLLLRLVTEDTTTVCLYFKKKFNRVRPNFLRKEIAPVIRVPGHPSYPSGHSTEANIIALVLGELFPKLKKEYVKSAEKIAKNREVAGVHYPSDSLAGKELANSLLNEFKKNKLYIKYFDMAAKFCSTTPNSCR